MLTSLSLVALGLALEGSTSLTTACVSGASAPVSVGEVDIEAARDALPAATEVLEVVSSATGTASTPHAAAASSTLPP